MGGTKEAADRQRGSCSGMEWSLPYDKAVEYVNAIMQGHPDEVRVILHKQLAAMYGLKPSETRHITDNLPIPMEPCAEEFDDTLAKCATLITNEFQKLRDIKGGGDFPSRQRKEP